MESKTLADLTKEKMGYVEVSPTCDKCKFHKEETDMSGGYYDVCTYSKIQHFSVKAKGCCNFFIDKNRQDATERTDSKA